MPHIEVYTANVGEKDLPRSDVRCFTSYNRFRDPRLNAKIYKVLPHLFIDAEFSIWVDANIELMVTPESLVSRMTADVMVYRHWDRDCLYEEASVCAINKQDDTAILQEQSREYNRRGITHNGGLAACGVIVRRHCDSVAASNQKWWAEICRYSVRDQVSFLVAFPDAQAWPHDPRGTEIKIHDHIR